MHVDARAILRLIPLLLLAGCSAAPAQLSARWVYASPGGVGVANAPKRGSLLTVASLGCVARTEIDQHFGKVCAAHETEGGAAEGPTPPPMTDEVPIGLQPTPGEPIWYCDGRVVVRVVLQRCGTEDKFSVQQVAVAIEAS
jgi:hypothetical protein